MASPSYLYYGPPPSYYVNLRRVVTRLPPQKLLALIPHQFLRQHRLDVIQLLLVLHQANPITLFHQGRKSSVARRNHLAEVSIRRIRIPSRDPTDGSRTCDICGVEKSSNFRPVISEWIGKQRLLPDYLRVMSCNPCYCR